MMAREDRLFNQWVNNKKYKKRGGLLKRSGLLGGVTGLHFVSLSGRTSAHPVSCDFQRFSRAHLLDFFLFDIYLSNSWLLL